MPPSAPAQNSQQAMGNLQSFTQGMKSPQDVLSQANNQFGVSQQAQTVQGLRQSLQNTTNLLNNIAPSVMGRTANSLVTSAQANRQIQNEQAPLNTQFNQENQDYSNANQNLAQDQQQASTLANAELGQQNQQESYLQNLYNDMYTQEQNAAQLAAEKYAADAAARGSASASPSLGGGNNPSGQLNGPSSVGRYFTNAAGGYGFADANGQPITMGQYLYQNGYQGQNLIQKASQMLAQSNSGDKGIANAIAQHGYTPAQLEKLFPNVFGGTY